MFKVQLTQRITRLAFSIAIGFLCIYDASAQMIPAAVQLPGTYTHNFHSKITGQDYQLFVSTPDSYNKNDTVTYPVLYLLDGNPFFPLLQSMQHFYVSGEE